LVKKNQKNQNKNVDIDLSSLAEDAGLTLLRDSTYATVLDRLPTFLPRLDSAIGGGFPFGRLVEIAGSAGGGKSVLTHHAARVGTALGCIVVLVDVEGTSDKERLSSIGVDTSKVLVKQPDPEKGIDLTVEEVGRTIENTLELFTKKYPNIPVIYIWDSVGQTPSEVELDKDYGDQNVGARAKAITQFVTKINPLMQETKSILLAINQVRADVGGNSMFPTMQVPGGKAWEHAASLRLEIKKKQAIKKSDDKIGHTMGVKINKSKVSRPHQEVNTYLISDRGIDYEYNLAIMAEEEKVLDKVGQSYEYVDANGEIHKKKKENFIEWLRTAEAQPVREEILNKLIQVSFPNGHTALTNQSLNLDGWMDNIYPSNTPQQYKEEEPSTQETSQDSNTSE